MFRSARAYRITNDWPESEEALSNELQKSGFAPCGPLTERSSGWVEVNADLGESFARRLHGADLMKLRSQSRVLPAAVVNEALEERIDEWRQRMDEPPGRRDKRRLKLETRDSLLPKALVKSDKLWGYFDLGEQLLVIDTGQEAAADRFVRHLQLALGELEIRPLEFAQPVGDLLKKMFLGDTPGDIHIGRECRMQDATDTRSTVRWNDFDLSDASIRSHVADGMRLTHLAIVYDNILSCVLDENGRLTKIKLLGADDDDTGAEQDPLARFDAEFVLLSSTLRRLYTDLKKLLGGYKR